MCGDFARWREEEKQTKREHDRAESAWGTATHEKKALEAQVAAWPWQYTKTERKIWLRGAELARSPIRGAAAGSSTWAPRLRGSAHSSHRAGLPPYPATGAGVPAGATHYSAATRLGCESRLSSGRRGVGADRWRGAGDSGRARRPRLTGPGCGSPGSERGETAGKRATLRELAGRIATAEASMAEAARALAANPYVGCPNRANHRRTERERHHYAGLRDALDRDLAGARKAAARQAHRTLRSLRAVLESFGYMTGGEPTRRLGCCAGSSTPTHWRSRG